MPTKEKKIKSLNQALVLTKEYARGGQCAQALALVLKNLYDTLNQISDDIDKTEN